MSGEIKIHDIERRELVEKLNQWLADCRTSDSVYMKQEINDIERLLRALQSGGSLSAEDSDLLLLVLGGEIHKLQKFVANPESYLPPTMIPPVSGLFKAIKLQRAEEEQAHAREQVIRDFRHELIWLQLLEAKIKALKGQ